MLGNILRTIYWTLRIGLILAAVGVLHYALPAKDVVRIVGTDVKRMDVVSGEFVTEDNNGTLVVEATRDVRFINTIQPDNEPMVYRNEETGWGFPWYLKFDSGNIQAVADDLVSTSANPKWVIITHYGWRIELLSMFPNAISIEETTGPDVSSISWARIFILFLIAVAIFSLWRLYRRFRDRHLDPLVDRIDDSVSETYHDAEESFDRASGTITRRWDRFRDWLSTWSSKSPRR